MEAGEPTRRSNPSPTAGRLVTGPAPVSAHAVGLAAASAQFAVDFDAIEVPVEKGRAPFDERMVLALSDLKGEAARPATPSLWLQQSAGTPAPGLWLSPLCRARGAVGRCGASST